ncbi:HNH endonuclease [Flagellimonas marinaquae]|uniref:HNH endonuclease n=1 Tax=Flagellimonas marinaquae TaxID=254955 RepID=UPI002074D660|nr:HNH endonuclease [Allomuricauda aquimarina]USD26601.1 HNH endonuclease [Allomuricauda aquimarina]
MRNPKWHRDEIILTLNLYFELEPGQIHNSNPKVIELSELLNSLPLHEVRPDAKTFRNPNGVSLKLSNFLAIDPDSGRKGMTSFSQLDKKVFEEFYKKRAELKIVANRIKTTLGDKSLKNKLLSIEDLEEDFDSIREGEVIYKLHKYRERNPKITKVKKDKYFKENGKLDCEVCSFDFFQTYGKLGKGFIECHHRTPISELEPNSKTKLSDLALVCSNCHRMLHREINTLSIEALKAIINKKPRS